MACDENLIQDWLPVNVDKDEFLTKVSNNSELQNFCLRVDHASTSSTKTAITKAENLCIGSNGKENAGEL